ncbi:hypothetical protein CR513_02119, partial [Mucuna pruriens]
MTCPASGNCSQGSTNKRLGSRDSKTVDASTRDHRALWLGSLHIPPRNTEQTTSDNSPESLLCAKLRTSISCKQLIVSGKWPMSELELTSKTCISVKIPTPWGMQPVNWLFKKRISFNLGLMKPKLKGMLPLSLLLASVEFLVEEFIGEWPGEVVESEVQVDEARHG